MGNVRGSVITPVSAEAAAVSGLQRYRGAFAGRPTPVYLSYHRLMQAVCHLSPEGFEGRRPAGAGVGVPSKAWRDAVHAVSRAVRGNQEDVAGSSCLTVSAFQGATKASNTMPGI